MKVAVDIGAQFISVAVGYQQGNKIVVKDTFKVKTPPFTIKDGEILNVELLADVLNNAFLNNKVKAGTISVSVNSTQMITREMNVPKSSHKQLLKMIQNEMFMSKNLTNNYIIDYTVIEEFESKKNTQYKIMAAAIPENIIEGYMLLCGMLGFRKNLVDIEFNGIYKTFAIQPDIVSKDKPIIVASIGTNNAIFLIIEQGKIVFSKTIALNISKYINLTSDKKTIDYTKVDLTTNFSENRRRLIEDFANDIANEISKIMQFQFARSSFRSIDDIYLIGAITNSGGLEKRISMLLGANIKAIAKPDCIKTRLNFKYSQYVSTIGGLIRLTGTK